MGRIYRDLREIPMPSDTKFNRKSKQVSKYYQLNGSRRRIVVGVYTEDGKMHVNDNFRVHYPELWEKYYGKIDPLHHQVCMGLYAAGLGIGHYTGLYQDLLDAFGPQSCNASMDFALYSLREQSSTAQLFQEAMETQMLFSRKPYSDAWYSEFFRMTLTESKIHDFKIRRLRRFAEQNRKVWLCIDGSNNDCVVENSELSAFGESKSHNSKPIVSYIWAVDASDARPVTWFVNNGSTPDCKAFDEVIKFLGDYGIGVEGVILDRGFASNDVINAITACNLDYVVMLKGKFGGFRAMFEAHANDIHWKVEHAVSDDGVFGLVGHHKLFDKSPEMSCIGLFFSGVSNSCRFVKLIGRVRKVTRELRAQIRANAAGRSSSPNAEADPNAGLVIPSDLKNILSFRTENGKIVDVECNNAAWQQAGESGGYFAIATRTDKTAEEIYNLYRLRDACEKQYAIVKTQLDAHTFRVHSDAAIHGRMAVCFVAAVLRTEIMNACKALGLDTNVMIRKLDSLYCLLAPDGSYRAILKHSNALKALLEAFGIRSEHWQFLANEINEQNAGPVYAQVRKLPEVVKRGRGRPPKTEAQKAAELQGKQAGLSGLPKRGPGRPKGSLNKKTIERMEREKAEGIEPKPKRKPGRPKGSKNRSTIEREQREAEQLQNVAPIKRGPGRPKGSRNKATIEREKQKDAERLMNEPVKRGPGRPKGSKNRKTLAREAAIAKAGFTVSKTSLRQHRKAPKSGD